MAFAVTNTFTGQTSLSASELDQNFTDIEAKINGNIGDGNIYGPITSTKLDLYTYEMVINWSLHGTELNQALTADLVIGAVPYYSAAATYNIRSVEYMFMLDTGAAITGLVGTLEHGNATDGFIEIEPGIAVGAVDAVTRLAAGDLTASTITTSAARPKFFRFNVTTAGANYAAGDSFCLSILLQHALR